MKRRLRILIVEDETDTRDTLALILSMAGYTTIPVEDGRDALSTLEARVGTTDRVDILVTDINMPDMNGLDLIRRARTLDPKLLILAMSAFGTRELVRDLRNAGVDDYLDKPFQMGVLARRVSVLATGIADADNS